MRKYKILFVDDVFDFGGGEQHLLCLISKLDASKFEISIACREGSLLSQKGQELGCSINYIRFRNKYDLFGLLSFYKMLKRNRYDIVHLQDNRSHWIGGIAAKAAGVPVKIATVHMVNIHRRVAPSRAEKCILGFADIIWTSMVDFIITVSEFNRRELIKEGVKGNKVRTIYNAVELKIARKVDKNYRDLKQELGLVNGELVIGTVSRLSEQKGIEYLIEASEKLIKNHNNVHFIIVGDGPSKDALIEKARKSKVHEKIKFLGFKSNPADYLAIFDIFVLPSVYEGLPIAILEAMAESKPVIATDVGGVSEIIRNGENGYLVPSMDVDSLYRALEILIKDQQLRSSMGKIGKRIIEERYFIGKMAEETQYIYQMLSERKMLK